MPDELMMRPSMPDSKWSAGSLRIVSRTFTASDVSARLGIAPDDQSERGSPCSPRNPASRRLESSVWILKSGLGRDRWPEEHIAALVERLSGKIEALSLLAAECEMELFIGFGSDDGQGGCVLPAGLLKEVGLLGLDVVLDLYPPTPDDDTSSPS